MPAETLPVLAATELVATIPVPASPSGGQSGIPAESFPDASRSFAPASVRVPALAPAETTLGRRFSNFHGIPFLATTSSNLAIIPLSNCPLAISIGNIPDASPTPSTFSPVNCQ